MYKVLEMKFDIFPQIQNLLATSKLSVNYLLDPSSASQDPFELHDV